MTLCNIHLRLIGKNTKDLKQKNSPMKNSELAQTQNACRAS